MRERGILFTGAMVRALLAGKKTQTRRAVKAEATAIRWANDAETFPNGRYTGWVREAGAPFLLPLRCPYGQPGDRLWVRETWQQVSASVDPETNIVDDVNAFTKLDPSQPSALAYAADDGWENTPTIEERGFPWRPSLLMPRWASRLTLEVTGIRVERAQDISDADVEAEGVDAEAVRSLMLDATRKRTLEAWPPEDAARWGEQGIDRMEDLPRRELWRLAWTLINGRESWDANPWVWVVEFRRLP